jgi:hypothetical protein
MGANDDPFRPSWSGGEGYLNAEHQGIWAACEHIPGWQAPGDSAKLYEMAYYCGDCILEIGTFGGRSATVELRGALRACSDRRAPEPQFFGIDVDAGSIARTRTSLEKEGLMHYVALFHGNLRGFHERIPITPTMVFVDGDHEYAGVAADMELLRTFLAPGTPVLCHDYRQIDGVRRAVDEWVAKGWYETMGEFGCACLLRASNRCTGSPRTLSANAFRKAQRGEGVWAYDWPFLNLIKRWLPRRAA